MSFRSCLLEKPSKQKADHGGIYWVAPNPISACRSRIRARRWVLVHAPELFLDDLGIEGCARQGRVTVVEEERGTTLFDHAVTRWTHGRNWRYGSLDTIPIGLQRGSHETEDPLMPVSYTH